MSGFSASAAPASSANLPFSDPFSSGTDVEQRQQLDQLEVGRSAVSR